MFSRRRRHEGKDELGRAIVGGTRRPMVEPHGAKRLPRAMLGNVGTSPYRWHLFRALTTDPHKDALRSWGTAPATGVYGADWTVRASTARAVQHLRWSHQLLVGARTPGLWRRNGVWERMPVRLSRRSPSDAECPVGFSTGGVVGGWQSLAPEMVGVSGEATGKVVITGGTTTRLPTKKEIPHL